MGAQAEGLPERSGYKAQAPVAATRWADRPVPPAAKALWRLRGHGSPNADAMVAPVLQDLERQIVAANPLSIRAADRKITIELTGDMIGYVWSINGHTYDARIPLEVKAGERVEITMYN